MARCGAAALYRNGYINHVIFAPAAGKFEPAELSHVTEFEYLDTIWFQRPITDEAVKYLYPLHNLKEVWLEGTGVSEAGLQALREHLPNSDIRVVKRSD